MAGKKFMSKELTQKLLSAGRVPSRESTCSLGAFGLKFAICSLSYTVQSRDVVYFVLWQDVAWLGIVNGLRRANKLPPLSLDRFELALDRFEKESFATSLDPRPDQKADGSAGNSGACLPCAVCEETDTPSTNLLLVCDGCSLSVHQVCSVMFI